MSYATGLGPHFPWLLLQSTVKVSLFIWSAFSPEAADREGGDHVLWTQPILSSTKPSLSRVMKYKTLHRSQKKHLSELFTAKGLPQVLEAAANSFKQCWIYLCLCLFLYCFPILGASCNLSSQRKPMSCSLGLSLRVSTLCSLCCRTSGSAGSILFAQHAKDRDNKTHCHKQTIPGGGGQPSRCSLH